jgi:hypothetical protein
MDEYSFKVSTRKNKKYDVYIGDKYIVSFGDKRYQQYYDKLGHYSELNHMDDKRRLNYYKRFGKDVKEGTAKYFSHKYLW